MPDNHKPMTNDRARELLTNAVPDMALRMVIDHMKTIYDKYTLIDMLLTRGVKPTELIHDFGFQESYVKIIQHRNKTFGYTAYTPLGTVAAQIPWCDYMLHHEDNIMFLHKLTYKQLMTLPTCPERKLNNILYHQLNRYGHTMANIIALLQGVPIAKLWFKTVNTTMVVSNTMPAKETAVKMLSDYGVQSAYDIIMLRDEELNEIFRTDIDLAENFRKQTIANIIMLGTNITNIGTWSDDALAQITSRNIKTAYDLYHHNRLGWLKHMPDEVQAEIQQNLDAFLHEIDNMFAFVDS